jgi:hypothetical protein
MKGWREAQRRFEAAFGAERTAEIRSLLHAVAATDFSLGYATTELAGITGVPETRLDYLGPVRPAEDSLTVVQG